MDFSTYNATVGDVVMEISIILLKQILAMFLMIGIGTLLTKAHILSEQGSRELGKITLWVATPCVILQSFLVEFSKEKLLDLGFSFLLAIFLIGVNLILATIICGKRKPLDNFAVAFCNAGFIGVPLVQASFGTEAVFYLAPYMALMNFAMWTYGVVAITGDKKNITVKSVAMNPILIAMLLGIFFFLTQNKLPDVIGNVIGFMGNLNTPLAMIVLGSYLLQINWKKAIADLSLYPTTVLRLIIVPLINVACVWLFRKFSLEAVLVVLLICSTPIPANTAIFAQQYDKDAKRGVELVCISTLLSAVTVPAFFLLIDWLMRL